MRKFTAEFSASAPVVYKTPSPMGPEILYTPLALGRGSKCPWQFFPSAVVVYNKIVSLICPRSGSRKAHDSLSDKFRRMQLLHGRPESLRKDRSNQIIINTAQGQPCCRLPAQGSRDSKVATPRFWERAENGNFPNVVRRGCKRCFVSSHAQSMT